MEGIEITKEMRQEDYFARRRNFISDQHVSYHQSHIEIIKSVFGLSLVSLGFNFEVLKPEDASVYADVALWIVSSVLFFVIVVLCFRLFHYMNSSQARWVELLNDEIHPFDEQQDISEQEYDKKIKKIEDYHNNSDRLMKSAYILFVIAIIVHFFKSSIYTGVTKRRKT